jgi:hypothetical protein
MVTVVLEGRRSEGVYRTQSWSRRNAPEGMKLIVADSRRDESTNSMFTRVKSQSSCKCVGLSHAAFFLRRTCLETHLRQRIDSELLTQKAQLPTFDLRHRGAVPAVGHAQRAWRRRASWPTSRRRNGGCPWIGDAPLRTCVPAGWWYTLMRWRTGSLRCARDASRSSERQAMASG